MKRVLDFRGYREIFEYAPGDTPPATAPTPTAGTAPATTAPTTTTPATTAPATTTPDAGATKTPEAPKDDNKPSAATAVGDQLYNAFVDVYFILVSGIDGGYPDVVADLQSVSQQTDATKKGDAMSDVINKVSQKLNGDYKSAIGGSVKDFSDDLKKAYMTLVTSDEGKKSLDSINKMIGDSINKYVTELAAELKKAQAPVKKVEESFQTWKESLQLNEKGLFDKNLFPERRQELLSTIITPKMSQFKTIADTTGNSAYKQAATAAYTEMSKLSGELTKDDTWDKMKRSERKDRLANIPGDVEKIQSTMNDATTKFTTQLKIDKDVTDSLTAVNDKANDIKTKASELVTKQAAAEAKKKEDEAKKKAEEGKKKEEEDKNAPKEIKSGSVDKSNLKKSGENYQAIKDFQGKLNSLLPKDQQIKADGGYGTNTEQAIKRIAKMIGAVTGEDLIKATEDGKKLTPEFQKMVINFNDPKKQEEMKKLISGS